MKLIHARNWLALTLPVLAVTLSQGVTVRADGQETVEVRGGTATFDAATNVSAINIHGKSDALVGTAKITSEGDNLVIESLEAKLPVKTINTGLGLRDEHMRKHIFTTADGAVPDLQFSAEKTICNGSEAASTCQVSGQLAIRGTARPFTIALKVTRSGRGFRAIGDGMVKLATYGIPAPSQFGVHTQDDVKLHLDFVAHSTPTAVATRGVK